MKHLTQQCEVYIHPYSGGVAQLGEHLPCKQGVSGSIPLISTKKNLRKLFFENFTEERK